MIIIIGMIDTPAHYRGALARAQNDGAMMASFYVPANHAML